MIFSAFISILLKIIPVSIPAGIIVKFTFLPLCRPIPLSFISSLKGFLVNFFHNALYKIRKKSIKTTNVSKNNKY